MYQRKVIYLREYKQEGSRPVGFGRIRRQDDEWRMEVNLSGEDEGFRQAAVYAGYGSQPLYLAKVGTLEKGSFAVKLDLDNIVGGQRLAQADQIVIKGKEHCYISGAPVGGKQELFSIYENPKPLDEISPQVEEMAEPEKPSWQDRIFTEAKQMYPFEDDEIHACVRIEPKDFGNFPSKEWTLSKNSFLLHGFYEYRHMVFASVEEGDGYAYYVGVPGIYHRRDRFMAGMFGFTKFKGVRKKEESLGDFGYWMKKIENEG